MPLLSESSNQTTACPRPRYISASSISPADSACLAQQSAKVAFQHQHNLVVGDVGIIDTMKELRVEVVIGQVSPEHP
ncbi:MAG: hypothetical protein IPK19_22145 [Chloroflexi bacterium]|nr:hypothetical protein [Chloroflexota bacterium]